MTPHRKAYMDAYYKVWKLAHPDYEKNRWLTHNDQIKAKNKKWNLEHPEYNKKYRLAHPGQRREESRKFYLARKDFDFIPLNKPFDGSHRHHIDTVRIIYIPADMHKHNRHSVTKNQNMEEINTFAFNWLEAEELYALGDNRYV